ncbi:heavy metal translocating P-type ATPase [Tepidibacter formicigenes]|jgi:Cd2+/Zn2+-exporting ATPase|uniref:Cd(2+)-exporting ATPase n=1 Tax=Tepidibacter formicigenes DSM 15518 TaxID=1123349 RepID=A0A1M6N0H4_9FIRM|nr:heavy metal translocating P-type ATPase [Tepidibacter formicigenes]SHJ89239.1 Cd2+/Zn2+-exporting ATPase [Tepidibacter formicigenes DSM 15518]
MAIASVSAFLIGEYPEAVAVMLFYRLGEIFEHMAVNKSKNSITALLDIKPEFANLKVENSYKKVSPDEIRIGDIILVKPGEKVPLDGIVIEGESTLDTSVITGESIPREIGIHNEVFSGSINKTGALTIKVTKVFKDSTVSKILDLVEKANAQKAKTEKFITKFARYYTPGVVGAAVLLAIIPPILLKQGFFTWMHRAAIFLVVSCPCALVISIPLGYFGGIGGASRNGILIKGGNFIEALKQVDTVVFDKTGTLTKGRFHIKEILVEKDYNDKEVLEIAAHVEYFSNHPIAQSIVETYSNEIDESKVSNLKELSGKGIKAQFDKKDVLVGNKKLMKDSEINIPNINQNGTNIYVAIEGKYVGTIIITDELKSDTKKGIELLKKMGISKLVMLTGDHKNIAENIGKEVGIDEVYSELLPHEKVEKLELIIDNHKSSGKIMFVGDGINDAPVLARADIGVAMGGLGSDAAIESADVVLMTDEISKISMAIRISKYTNKIVWQNIILALGVKGIILILGALGIVNMWGAVFGDVGVATIAILNSMRVLKAK